MKKDNGYSTWYKCLAVTISVFIVFLGIVFTNLFVIIAGISILPWITKILEEHPRSTNTSKWIIFAILLIFGIATESTQAQPQNNKNDKNNSISKNTGTYFVENLDIDLMSKETENLDNIYSNKTENENSRIAQDPASSNTVNNQIQDNSNVPANNSIENNESNIAIVQSLEPAESQNETITTDSTQNSIIVYVTDTGKKYHKEECEYLSKSKHGIDISVATELGYTQCLVCY